MACRTGRNFFPKPANCPIIVADLYEAGLTEPHSSAGHRLESTTPHVIAAAYAAAMTGAISAGVLRARYALVGAALFMLVAVVIAFMNRQRSGSSSPRRAFVTPAAIFLAGIAYTVVINRVVDARDSYILITELCAWLLGWGLYLLAVSGETHASHVIVTSDESRNWQSFWKRDAVIVGGFALLVLAIYHVVVAGRSVLVIDDTLYVLQARLFGQPHFSLPIDPEVIRFFMLRQGAYLREAMFSLYSPGWPAILAVFDAVGAMRWAGAILGAAIVGLTYILGLRVHSARVGAIAAGLLALHPVFLHRGNLYSSHSASAFFLVIAAILSVGDRPREPIQIWRWLAIGLSLGIAFTSRTLTGLAVGSTIAVWYIIRTRPPLPRLTATAILTIVGAVPALVATGLYNMATTGNPTEFGYSVSMRGLHDIGFGRRGFVTYAETGLSRELVSDFTLRGSLIEQAGAMWTLALTLLPVGLLIPLSTAVKPFGALPRIRTGAAFLLLPVAYLFWFFHASWYYVDMLPFVFLGTALMLERTRQKNPRLARNFGIYLLLIAPTVAVAETYRVRQIYEPCREAYDDVERMRPGGRLLVFADDKVTNQLSEMTLECLWVFNTRGIHGDVVVARDLDALNGDLIKRYPGYRAVRVKWNEAERRNVFTPVQP